MPEKCGGGGGGVLVNGVGPNLNNTGNSNGEGYGAGQGGSQKDSAMPGIVLVEVGVITGFFFSMMLHFCAQLFHPIIRSRFRVKVAGHQICEYFLSQTSETNL